MSPFCEASLWEGVAAIVFWFDFFFLLFVVTLVLLFRSFGLFEPLFDEGRRSEREPKKVLQFFELMFEVLNGLLQRFISLVWASC